MKNRTMINSTNVPPSLPPPGLNPCWHRSKPTAPWWCRPSSTKSTSMTWRWWSTCRQRTPSTGPCGACTRVLHQSITSWKTPRYPGSRLSIFISLSCFNDIAVVTVTPPPFPSPGVPQSWESWSPTESFLVKSDSWTWGWKCTGVKM